MNETRDVARIAVIHPDPADRWITEQLGRSAVIRPAGHGKGVFLWFEHKRPEPGRPDETFDADVARLGEITGLPVVHEWREAPRGVEEAK